MTRAMWVDGSFLLQTLIKSSVAINSCNVLTFSLSQALITLMALVCHMTADPETIITHHAIVTNILVQLTTDWISINTIHTVTIDTLIKKYKTCRNRHTDQKIQDCRSVIIYLTSAFRWTI